MLLTYHKCKDYENREENSIHSLPSRRTQYLDTNIKIMKTHINTHNHIQNIQQTETHIKNKCAYVKTHKPENAQNHYKHTYKYTTKKHMHIKHRHRNTKKYKATYKLKDTKTYTTTNKCI